MRKTSTTLLKAVRLIVARKVIARRHPLIATEREVRELRGVSTTPEEINDAAAVLRCGKTFYENYYELLNQTNPNDETI